MLKGLKLLLQAEQARRDFPAFYRFVYGLEMARHQELWLRAVSRHKKVLIIAPPESGKSTFFSIAYPSWHLGYHPNDSIMSVSTSLSQAASFHGALAETIEYNDDYKLVFPHIRPDYDKGWTKGAGFVERTVIRPDPSIMCAGVMGPIIGRRVDLMVVDDPLDQASAMSPTLREKIRRWFWQTVSTRVTRTGKIVCIMTRWHEDDLAADLSKKRSGFKVVHVPAISEDGKSYWPKQWPIERLEERREELGPEIFDSMFQGFPRSLAGRQFDSDTFEYYDKAPEMQMIIQGWDVALKAKETNDYTVCLTLGVDGDENLYILDMFRARLTAPQIEDMVYAQYDRHRPSQVFMEDAASGTAVMQYVAERSSIPILPVKARQDKVTRAKFLGPLMTRGKLRFPAVNYSRMWAREIVEELSLFPLGRHDDIVDALVYACLGVQKNAGLYITTV